MKKIACVVLVLLIALAVGNPMIYAEYSDIDDTHQNLIIIQAIAQDEHLIYDSSTNYTIKDTNGAGVNGLSGIDDVIQFAEYVDNDLIKQTTILPYKISENGSLVNSFAYADQLMKQEKLHGQKASVSVDTNFVDITITVITYYAQYFSMYNIATFYRHAGIEAYWSSNNSSASITSLLVRYDTAGDLYRYPECINQSLNTTWIQNNYFIRSTISKVNPIKGTVYIDGNNTMPYNRVVLLTDFFAHGGLIYVKSVYSVNGKSYNHDRSYYVYTK